MRQIKFRGKRINGGEWVYGDLWQPVRDNQRCTFILRQDIKYEVDPATAGQFTGLLDKNGVEIYEGSIVKLCYGIPPTFDTLLIEYADDENVADISVSGWWMRNIRPNGCSSSLCKTYKNDIEIIGNIHSNPELLEAKND